MKFLPRNVSAQVARQFRDMSLENELERSFDAVLTYDQEHLFKGMAVEVGKTITVQIDLRVDDEGCHASSTDVDGIEHEFNL